MDNSDGNVLRTIAHDMFKKRLIRNIGQSPVISWEKAKPTELKGASGKVLDPQKSH